MTETSNTCLTCSLFRPDSDPRIPNYPPICDGDRALIDRHLTEIANLFAVLSNPEPPIVDKERYERFGVEYIPKGGGARKIVSLGTAWADPLAAFGGVAPINSRSKAPSVSGSREKPLPVNAAVLDLKARARVPNPTDAARDWSEDQIGNLSAATVLDQWVRDVRDTLCPEQHLPAVTVDELVMWLRNRLDDICDQHPAVAEFAEEIRSLRSALRSAAGETEPPPEPCDGVSCARCKMRSLCRKPGDTYRAECSTCGTLYTDDEYTALTEGQAKIQKDRLEPDKVAELLRHS